MFITSQDVLPIRLLSVRDVCLTCRIGRSCLYELIKNGQFPKGILIGRQSRRWLSTEISEWITRQMERAEERERTYGVRLKEVTDRARRAKARKGADHG